MRVLFLLSCLEPAGSETYCVELAKAWGTRHEVFWISDRLHYGQPYTSYPIHKKAIPGGVLNTWRVWRFIREHRIELIHSHSRRAHWVAAQAATLAKIPHVTTIHQPPPVHMFSQLWPCLGDHTIAIDEAVQEHLHRHFPEGVRHMSLIRNGISLPPAFPDQKREGNNILYIGRLTGGRWRALRFFLNVLQRVAHTLPQTHFHIVGRIPEERASELIRLLKFVNQEIHPSSIETQGFVPELGPLVAGCRGVIAGGRSAIESMAIGKPVLALGEKGVIGLCNEETWQAGQRSNFGDHFGTLTDQFFPAKLEIGLRELLNTDPAVLGRWGQAQVEKDYAVETVAKQVTEVYDSVATRRNGRKK